MSWNHRLIRHNHKGEVYYQIHTVYYNEKGEPDGCSLSGSPVGGDDIDEVKWVLDEMRECLNEPVLNYEDIN
jgi:hypothetical protein